jgi:hypothetical protein
MRSRADVAPGSAFAAAFPTDGGDEHQSAPDGSAPSGSGQIESGSDNSRATDAEADEVESAREVQEPAEVESDAPRSAAEHDATPALTEAAAEHDATPEPTEVAAEHDATPAPTEASETVEWHAPSVPAQPAVTSPPSNGNGIPPAPSDGARYDDIWTAAFAPPEQPASPANDGPHMEAAVAATTDVEPSETIAETAAVTAEAPSVDTSPDDLPSPPEDEISAEDDMWSLRARLAEAAARKKSPHGIG